jgi:hypothetical protein
VCLCLSSSSLSLYVFLFLVLFGCVLTRAVHTHSQHALVAFSTSLRLLRLNQVPFCCSSRASKLSALGRGSDRYTTDFTNGRQSFRGLQVRITHARTHFRHSLTDCSLQACTVVSALTVLTQEVFQASQCPRHRQFVVLLPQAIIRYVYPPNLPSFKSHFSNKF